MTLAGILFDEVALMPKSFVTQGMARCSVAGSKMWFNCNPSYPSHWFKKEIIDHAENKRFLYLHFLLDDNLSLTENIKQRYKTQFSGVFYKRYILGEWCKAEGLIYPMYESAIAITPDTPAEEYAVSIDYGTQNAFAALVWSLHEGVWYAENSYYYSGRTTGVQKTDEEYGKDIDLLLEDIVETRAQKENETQMIQKRIKVIVDPSAASFIAELRKRKHLKVLKADNDVQNGIRETATAMYSGRIKIEPTIQEFRTEAEGYVWDEKENDKPVKENDHCMDSIRYFVRTMRVMKNRKVSDKYTNVYEQLNRERLENGYL
jgi:PBSX family phage terminase large subunit